MSILSKMFTAFPFVVWQWKMTNRREKLWSDMKYQELLLLCDEIITRDPHDHFAFYYKGLAYECLNFLDEAIFCFEQAEQVVIASKWKSFVRPYYSSIPIQMSRVYNKKRDKEKAFYYADKAVQADKDGINGLKWRAALKEESEDYIGASEDLNEALKRKPKDGVLKKMRDRLTYIIIEDRREKASR